MFTVVSSSTNCRQWSEATSLLELYSDPTLNILGLSRRTSSRFEGRSISSQFICFSLSILRGLMWKPGRRSTNGSPASSMARARTRGKDLIRSPSSLTPLSVEIEKIMLIMSTLAPSGS